MTLYVLPIVEGKTEQGCVERLLQRVWTQLLCCSERLQIVEPFRGSRASLVHPSGAVLTDSVRKAFFKLRSRTKRDAESRSLLLILLDAEGDCPAILAPRLLDVAKRALPAEAPIACVLAKRMLENWIVAGASTLAGVNDLPDSLQSVATPEECSGAAWLAEQLRKRNKSRKYKKPTDATAFIAAMDLAQCRKNAPSFDKLCRELTTRLLPPPPGTQPHSPDSDEPVAKA